MGIDNQCLRFNCSNSSSKFNNFSDPFNDEIKRLQIIILDKRHYYPSSINTISFWDIEHIRIGLQNLKRDRININLLIEGEIGIMAKYSRRDIGTLLSNNN